MRKTLAEHAEKRERGLEAMQDIEVQDDVERLPSRSTSSASNRRYSDLGKLAVTVERELTPFEPNPVASREPAIVAAA